MYRQPHPLYAPHELAPVLLALDRFDLAAPPVPLAEAVSSIRVIGPLGREDDPRDRTLVMAALAGRWGWS